MLKRFRGAGSKTVRLMRAMIESIENSPLTLTGFSLAFLSLILVRLLVEGGTNSFATEPVAYMFYEFTHTFLFFLFAFLVFLPVVRLAGATSWTGAANLLLFGFLIIWTPPIIDKIIFGGEPFWSFYELDSLRGMLSQFFTFFDDTPRVGITYGVRVEVAVMTTVLGLYAFFKSRKFPRSVGITVLTYAIFFVLGTFPSWVAIPVLGTEKGVLAVTEFDVVGYMLSPDSVFGRDNADPRMSLGAKMSIIYATLSILAVGTLLFASSKKTFLALFRNARIPQVIWHGGLLFLGGGLAMIFAESRPDFDFFEILSIILLVAAVESAWLSSVVGNDLADRKIDERTNPSRPMPTGDIPTRLYAEIGILFFFASLLFSAIVSWKVMLLLLAYQGLAWVYSMPPLRLKRVPGLATVLAAMAGMTVLIAGFSVLAPEADIRSVPFPLLSFLFIAYAVTLPLKDFKDVEGDRSDGVLTIPVLLGEERARLAIGSAIFLCYMASPVILHESSLVVPAILFGSLSFWSVVRAEREKRPWGTFRTLPGWNILFIALYGAFVTLILL